MFGWATPTEAAAVGALGSILLTVMYGRIDVKTLKEALLNTVTVTAMIMFILLAGNLFATVFSVAGGLAATENLIFALTTSEMVTVLILLGLAFLAGFVLDLISIILIMIPIAIPIIEKMELYSLDPSNLKSWFCVIFLVMIQTSYLSPPLAPAIFYLKAIAPPEIKLRDMYQRRGSVHRDPASHGGPHPRVP